MPESGCPPVPAAISRSTKQKCFQSSKKGVMRLARSCRNLPECGEFGFAHTHLPPVRSWMVSPNLRGWSGTWEGDRSFSRKSLRARQAQPKLKSAQARQAPAAAAHHHRWFPKYGSRSAGFPGAPKRLNSPDGVVTIRLASCPARASVPLRCFPCATGRGHRSSGLVPYP